MLEKKYVANPVDLTSLQESARKTIIYDILQES
jgi:hypothetical protein